MLGLDFQIYLKANNERKIKLPLKKIKKEFERFIIKKFKKIDRFQNYLDGDGYFTKSFSTSGEDSILKFILECEKGKDYKGFYVDIGAHHPFSGSNTQYLYEKGWRGINIDACPTSMEIINKYRTEDINLLTGVSNVKGIFKFNLFNIPVLNGLDNKVTKEYLNSHDVELVDQIDVQVDTLEEILDRHLPVGCKIDLMNIDVEGVDFEVLESNNWSKYKPQYLLIEYIHDGYEIEKISENPKTKFLKEKGYKLVAISPLTMIFSLETT